jgi:very-short-patch-repair endonuclease
MITASTDPGGSRDVRAELARLGGAASAAELLGVVSRPDLRRAVAGGEITRVRRDRYALTEAFTGAQLLAAKLDGTISHLSAAQAHGWSLKLSPDRPWITVPRGRARVLAPAHLRVADLPEAELGLTGPLRTVIDCARVLPFDEALAVADSALRRRDLTAEELAGAGKAARGPGARAVRAVLAAADGRAQNPFESVLRAMTLEFPLSCEPQGAVEIDGFVIHPDLVEHERRVVLEADSFTFHASREGHGRDCARYNALVMHGWRVLRFTWEHVIVQQPYVRGVLSELCAITSPQRRGLRR